MSVNKPLSVFLIILLSGCASQIQKTIRQDIPEWVAFPNSYFDVETGVGCELADNSSTKGSLREITQHKAMVDLLRKLEGNQKLFSNESVTSEGEGDARYKVEIKTKTYGTIGRNFVVKEGLVKNKRGKPTYCSAVQLVNN